MNYNIAMMKVKRMELVEQQTSLRFKGKALARRIPSLVNPSLQAVEEMELVEAANLMDELVMTQAELFTLTGKIKELEADLGI